MHLLASLMASEAHANLTGWYIGFVITTIAIVIVVIEVQAILVIARTIALWRRPFRSARDQFTVAFARKPGPVHVFDGVRLDARDAAIPADL